MALSRDVLRWRLPRARCSTGGALSRGSSPGHGFGLGGRRPAERHLQSNSFVEVPNGCRVGLAVARPIFGQVCGGWCSRMWPRVVSCSRSRRAALVGCALDGRSIGRHGGLQLVLGRGQTCTQDERRRQTLAGRREPSPGGERAGPLTGGRPLQTEGTSGCGCCALSRRVGRKQPGLGRWSGPYPSDIWRRVGGQGEATGCQRLGRGVGSGG